MFKKYRKHNKVYELPKDMKEELDDMLRDTSISYVQMSEYLKEQGYDISKSTIGRYALETHKLANKLMEAQSQVAELVKMAKQEDGENITEGAMQIATVKLTEKIAMLDTEIDEMDAGEAIKLITNLSRSKAYKDKVYDQLRNKYELVYEAFKKEIKEALSSDPDLRDRLIQIAEQKKDSI